MSNISLAGALAQAFAAALVLLTGSTSSAEPRVGDVVQNGDLVFQVSRSDQSEAIALATRSPWTHMGVVRLRGRTAWVFEAAARVQLTPLATWVANGKDRAVVVKRLRDADQLLTAAVLTKMEATGRPWIGRPYDLLFKWSDDSFYCSELVYKLYRDAAGISIGQPQPAGTFDLQHPVVRAKIKQRFGQRFDRNEPIISPQSMFDDPRLISVYESAGVARAR